MYAVAHLNRFPPKDDPCRTFVDDPDGSVPNLAADAKHRAGPVRFRPPTR